jgi:membrane-associated phospholipid phosphatase
MHSMTNSKGTQLPTSDKTAGGEDRQKSQQRYRVEAVFWVIGFIIFVIACVTIHGHPQPYPFELTTTETVQGIHLLPWLHDALVFPSILNNIGPSLIAMIIWVAWMLLMALIFHLRGRSPLNWIKAAVFLALTVSLSYGMQGITELLVNRPRPDPHHYPIHVYTPLVPYPTFPSGHTEFDTLYYGSLLYLSFTRPVREWRYRWLLIPLQLFAVYALLTIGYSRILEGDHWLLDVLGGYLEGAIYLFIFIALFRWATAKLAQRQAKKMAQV